MAREVKWYAVQVRGMRFFAGKDRWTSDIQRATWFTYESAERIQEQLEAEGFADLRTVEVPEQYYGPGLKPPVKSYF